MAQSKERAQCDIIYTYNNLCMNIFMALVWMTHTGWKVQPDCTTEF